MSRPPLTLTAAFGPYDRTRALHDGTVAIEGCRLAAVAMAPGDMFPRAFQRAEFDMSELSASTQLIAISRGRDDYVALPVFLSRSFRLDAIYVRSDSGIRTPEDLQGRVVGTPEFQMTAGVFVRGILQDRFGVDLRSITYVTGGLNVGGRKERVALTLPPDWNVQPIDGAQCLNDLLEAGQIDAVIAPQPPTCFVNGSGVVRRLFDDPAAEEKAYFKDTGIFPVMHVLGVRKSVLAANPWLAASVETAFEAAKTKALAGISQMAEAPAPPMMLPWLQAEWARTRAVLGDDPWPYGLSRNRAAVEALCRYAHDQGLLERPVSVDELFPLSS